VKTNPVACISKAQILLLECVQLTANIELHDRQLFGSDRAGKHVTLLLVIELGTRNCIVDGLANGVADEGESGTGVGNGSVV